MYLSTKKSKKRKNKRQQEAVKLVYSRLTAYDHKIPRNISLYSEYLKTKHYKIWEISLEIGG